MQDMMATCQDMACVDNDVDITPVDDSPNVSTFLKSLNLIGFISLYVCYNFKFIFILFAFVRKY